MKYFAALCVTLASCLALAGYPEAGNFAKFATADGSFQVEYVNDGQDKATSVWNIEIKTNFGGSAEQWADDDMATPAKMQALLAMCASPEVGGKSETIKVPAGQFKTCKITDDEGAIMWLADVPFGMAKYQGDQFTLELTDYSE